MLEKEIDPCEISSISVFNSKDDYSNVSAENSEKVGGENKYGDSESLTTDALLGFLSEHDKRFEENPEVSVPLDYQLLPEEFFNFEGIPPPLVSTSWLKLLSETDSDADSGEDLPLSKLKSKLQKNKKKKKTSSESRKLRVDESNSFKQLKKFPKGKKLKKSKVEAKEFSLINRKRGRPKKCEKELVKLNIENDFSNDLSDVPDNENNEFFWNDQSASSDLVNSVQEDEPENIGEKDSAVVINHTEHDYFKTPDIDDVDGKEETKVVKKKKKKERTVVQGIKTEDSKISFPCIECGKSFSAASTLKSHLRIHNGTLLICTECHKGFTTKYLLKCHMRIHNGDLFMCHKCGKGFITAELLKVHNRGHTGDRPFFCNICKRSFPSASNLSQHKQTHNPEKKFLCFQCGSSFSQKRCLDGHMLTHAERSHICNVCGKLWARKSDLSEHMRVHTGVKPYCCKLCPQKFTQASSLKRHRIVHMDIKPIQCLTCSKMFKCQEYYKRHLRKHEKEADCLFNNVEDK